MPTWQEKNKVSLKSMQNAECRMKDNQVFILHSDF